MSGLEYQKSQCCTDKTKANGNESKMGSFIFPIWEIVDFVWSRPINRKSARVFHFLAHPQFFSRWEVSCSSFRILYIYYIYYIYTFIYIQRMPPITSCPNHSQHELQLKCDSLLDRSHKPKTRVPPHRPIRILAIDGGGVKALIPLKVLQFIEEYTGKPVTELFDLVAGTSSGGIVTAGLTAPLKPGKSREPLVSSGRD
jgi:hypothetical protein